MNLTLIIKYLFLYLIFIKNVYSIKISVILPVYNTSKYLKRILSAIINQTLSDIEIICIDDASTDNSIEILKKYGNNDNRIKIIHFDINKGVSVARNKGIELATGEFLSFMDSDDYVDKKYLEYLYSYSKGYDVVVTHFARGTNESDDYYLDKGKHYNNGYLFDSIFRKEFLDKNNIRFNNKRRRRGDYYFRKNCYKYNPIIVEAPDVGIYYYYKERLGSIMNKSEERLKKVRRRAEGASKRRNIKNQL